MTTKEHAIENNDEKDEFNEPNATESNGFEKAATPKPVNKKKKAAPSKTAKLEKEIATLREEKEAFKDQLLRKAAEFDNYKKRTESEFSHLVATANAELIADLLPVCDDLERSLAAAKDKEDFTALLEGVELISKNLLKAMEKYGVQQIEAIGKEFDPEQHEALMQVESKEYDSGVVVDEHLKGYSINDKVIRHSQVLVSK